eukprot:gnl/MRDRNA2_/MRDRNA2_123493_c0_seq1.p1 gnl/MRDRNA2_/MRDRNA2_123493_c0~~gnl/MRDRNA2_/MRDRNA2_123493_c0_seq1.p1  ORF type:complete len:268 (+),score=26.79 gnl/MRDRNA2_/MRDRNA2_123493_c0_seq1:92-895(+)
MASVKVLAIFAVGVALASMLTYSYRSFTSQDIINSRDASASRNDRRNQDNVHETTHGDQNLTGPGSEPDWYTRVKQFMHPNGKLLEFERGYSGGVINDYKTKGKLMGNQENPTGIVQAALSDNGIEACKGLRLIIQIVFGENSASDVFADVIGRIDPHLQKLTDMAGGNGAQARDIEGHFGRDLEVLKVAIELFVDALRSNNERTLDVSPDACELDMTKMGKLSPTRVNPTLAPAWDHDFYQFIMTNWNPELKYNLSGFLGLLMGLP